MTGISPTPHRPPWFKKNKTNYLILNFFSSNLSLSTGYIHIQTCIANPKKNLKDWNLLSKNKVLINRTFNDINQSNVISPIIKGQYSYLNFKKPALKNWKHIFSNIRNSQRTFDWFWSLKVLSIRSNHFLSERIFATLVPYVRRNISPVLTSKTHKKKINLWLLQRNQTIIIFEMVFLLFWKGYAIYKLHKTTSE